MSKSEGGFSTAIGANSTSEKEATALGVFAKATKENSVALGNRSVADEANTVSVGNKGATRKITNVTAGTADTDVVVVSQLNEKTNTALSYRAGVVCSIRRQCR